MLEGLAYSLPLAEAYHELIGLTYTTFLFLTKDEQKVEQKTIFKT